MTILSENVNHVLFVPSTVIKCSSLRVVSRGRYRRFPSKFSMLLNSRMTFISTFSTGRHRIHSLSAWVLQFTSGVHVHVRYGLCVCVCVGGGGGGRVGVGVCVCTCMSLCVNVHSCNFSTAYTCRCLNSVI